MGTTIHYVRELVGIVCTAEFIDLNRVIVKEVDELR